MNSYVNFVIAVIIISSLKTMSLLSGPYREISEKQVLILDGAKSAYFYPVLAGSDVPIPLAKPIATKTRTFGMSQIRYAVMPGTTMRDTRYPSVMR